AYASGGEAVVMGRLRLEPASVYHGPRPPGQRRRRFSPSPLAGEGWGGGALFLPPPLRGWVGVGGPRLGERVSSLVLAASSYPPPHPPPQGGREKNSPARLAGPTSGDAYGVGRRSAT